MAFDYIVMQDEFHEDTVIHFWGNDILKNTDECLKVIQEVIFNNTKVM